MRVFPSLASLSLIVVVACDCGGGGGPACETADDCAAGVCLDGRCVVTDASMPPDATGDALPDAVGIDVPCDTILCGSTCCREGERCAFGGCVIDLGPCATNDDCAGDSYCDDEDRCTPYGVPPDVTLDEDCERPIEIGAFEPSVQCHWTGEGAPLPTSNNVYSAPLVADFDFDDARDVLQPSLVFASFSGPADQGGVLRVVDGRTCATLHTLEDAADRLVYASNPTIGDLDGDASRPEIVATGLTATAGSVGLVAFGYDEGAATFVRRWYGRRCDLDGEPRHLVGDWANNNGPSMHDLDDDGVPEVLYDRFVYDANGCVLNPGASYTNYLRLGLFAVVADVDDDGAPELVRHDGVYRWTGSDWEREAYWAPTDVANAERVGHVAVADLGDFAGSTPGHAEIIVASAPASDSPASANGTVRVMTLDGRIVFGPIALPSDAGFAGRGGPPTIGDFDGDGRREIAVAGGSFYSVFDLDCDVETETAPGCARVAGLPRGMLWSRPSQDRSSNVTGSSVFDFDADGVAEVVYGDECFLRIYRGTDGEVLFSRSASSGTGYELPVIADVDGDFNSEIAVAMTSGVTCPATDPIYTRGISTHVGERGVIVLRDVEDRWAASRPIWNQHAYSVTHVRDDGTIPRTSEVARNHSDPTLNNFRMNAQGSLERRGAADLTVALGEGICGATGETTLGADVCNRGTNPVPDGARVVFYVGDPADEEIACETRLPRLLEPGTCTEVGCPYTIPEGERPDVTVVVDPDGEVFECRDGNNRGVIPAVFCGLI